MTSQFSASLMLADMDYIAPSQACIKPKLTRPAAEELTGGSVHRHVAGAAPPPELIQITLQDCLACSGCITTAETMLVTSQSRDEVLLAQQQWPNRPVAVSLSEQAVSSISVQLNRSVEDTFRVLSGFFRQHVGAVAVVEMSWATQLSRELTTAEYFRRVREAPKTLPLIVSSCPGWVCYCEKQYPELLPHLCPVMSPQGICGSVLKRLQAGGLLSLEAALNKPQVPVAPEVTETPSMPVAPPPVREVDPSRRDLFHLSVQPCFDRKLEAARDQDDEGVLYTDVVLSAQEVLMWMREVGPEDAGLSSWATPLDVIPSFQRPNFTSSVIPSETVMFGSGGYHIDVLQQLAATTNPSDGVVAESNNEDRLCRIVYDMKRNRNHSVARLEGPRSIPQPHLVTVAYGFQHIQNIVRGIRRKLSSTPAYTFIELMACPDGCLNGGGQVRTTAHEETLAAVREAFCAHQTIDATTATETNSPLEQLPAKMQRVELGALQHAFDEWLHGNKNRLPTEEHEEQGSVATVFPWSWVTTSFRDRKREMEEALQVNPIHSLRW